MAQNRAVNASIILMGIVLFALILRELESFLRPLAIAVILTLLLMPVFRYSKKKKLHYALSLAGIVMIIIVIIGLFGVLLATELKSIGNVDGEDSDINSTITKAMTFSEEIEIAGQTVDINKIIKPEKLGEFIASFSTKFIGYIGSIFSELFIALIFTLFLIPSHRHIIKNIEKNFNPAEKKRFRDGLLETEQSIRDYLYTKVLISLGTAISSMVVLFFFGAKYIIILGILLFVLNFIPNIGSIIAVAIAVAIYGFTFGFGTGFFALLILLIAIQTIFGNIIEPKFAGDKLSLSPIIILLSLFLWYWIWGIGGMILAIPLTSITKIILSRIKSTKNIAKFMS